MHSFLNQYSMGYFGIIALRDITRELAYLSAHLSVHGNVCNTYETVGTNYMSAKRKHVF